MPIGIHALVLQHLFAIMSIFTKALGHSYLLLNIGGEIRHAMLMEEMRIVILQPWDWVRVDEWDILHYRFCRSDTAWLGKDDIRCVHQHGYLIRKTKQT